MTHLVALLLLAQSTGSISGTVIDSVTGTPIRGARIHFGDSAQESVVTGFSGSFLFDRVPPREYRLVVVHPDYPPNARTGTLANTAVTLGPGERKQGIELRLTPPATVSGRIFDEDGDPLPNCSFSLIGKNGKNVFYGGLANSDSNGDYTFPTVPAGKYTLAARCEAPPLQPRPFAAPDAVLQGHQLGYSLRFYPGTPDFTVAQRLIVMPGQALRGLDFHLTPELISGLLVHVKDLPPGPQLPVTAALIPDQTPALMINARFAEMDPRTGTARFTSIPPGKYILRVTTITHQEMLIAKQQIQIGEQPGEVTVHAIPPISLAGTLHEDHPAGTKMESVWLIGMDDDTFKDTPVNADNSFAFDRLSPGRYRVQITGEHYVQSINLAGEPLEGNELNLKPGATGPLEVRVSNEKGTLSGEVALGSAHPAQIRIIAVDPYNNQSGLTDVRGQAAKFSVGMDPGHYRLYAVEYTQGKDLFEFLNDPALAARGEAVDIRAGSETVKNLKLITAEEIEKADPE